MSEPDVVMEFLEILRGIQGYRRWNRRRSLPIKHNEMMLLLFLNYHLREDCPGIQPSELGDILQLTRPAVTALVNSLEEQGYVERINAAEDRRVVFVRPTSKGEKLVSGRKLELANDLRSVLDRLGKSDTLELIRITRKVRTILEEKMTESDGSQESCGN